MKHYKPFLSFFISLALLVVFVTGCGDKKTANEPFAFSNDIAENGHWKDITALDYVTLSDNNSIAIPSEEHTITDEKVQSELNSLLREHSSTKEIRDRAVKNGDAVNIDFVGSVDGVEFERGNTGGAGTEVTIGVTNYIDNFLEQLIGHKPGETFNVNVTFPSDYGQDHLNGKDAVFVTTINFIVETVYPELTDAFVKEKLSSQYGWITIKEAKESIHSDLQKEALQVYIQNYMINNINIKSVPEKINEHQKNSMVKYYESAAESYSMDVNSYLSTYLGYSSMEELIESSVDSNAKSAKFSLVAQAIAENSKISVSDTDVEEYCEDDFTRLKEEYGIPYLKQMVLCEKVVDFLVSNAVLK